MLFREIFIIYCKKHIKYVSTMWKNAKFLNETADDTYGLPRVKKLKEK
jgi:hypothetical protein